MYTDNEVDSYEAFPGYRFTNLDTSTAASADRTVAASCNTNSLPQFPIGGVYFCTMDLAPETTGFPHRTPTLDYAAVLSGEVILALDQEEKTLRAGDVIVQKGTNHAWHNRTKETSRVLFVMMDSHAIKDSENEI